MTDQTPDPQAETDEAAATAFEPVVLQFGHKNIETEMRGKIQQALKHPLVPPDMEYLLIPAAIPNQQGQPMPAFVISLAIKGVAFGDYIHATAVLPTPWASVEDVTMIVSQLAQAVLDSRSSQASEQSIRDAAVQAGEQSLKGSVNGLIKPH